MILIGTFMVLFSAALCVYFALKHGIVRFHLKALGLLTAAVVFTCLGLLTWGWVETVMRAGTVLSVSTLFVLSCDKALHLWIRFRHAREVAGQTEL